MPKVFIGMPTYNGERFIREAIDSIRNQSFSDWALFISDDASTDKTAEICKTYAAKDPRIIYFRQEKNLGMFPNFKFVLDRANGDYFMWTAHDDIREKDYLSVTVSAIEKDKTLGFATTRMTAIDSFGRAMIEESGLTKFGGEPGYIKVARYIMEPEILGKCNLMYGLFTLEAAKETWRAYPQRAVWGQDYMFSLALLSRFKLYIDPAYSFKKRLGGFSSPKALDKDKKESVREIHYENPKNLMFPYGRFGGYLRGHLEALSGTPYKPLALLLYLRLPRAFIIHVKERSLANFFRRAINKLWQ